MARRGGLGKGLGALIPPGTELDADAGGLEELPVAAISPNRFQPRDHFDEAALAALADSIRAVGVLQPVLVRPVGEGYELVAGERRWRAARRVGMQTIPALVRETDDAAALEHALIENLHRDELNPGLTIAGMLLTMHDGRTHLGRDVEGEVRRHFPELVFDTVIPRNVRVGEAPSHGLPVIEHDPSCAGAEAYSELARELVAE